MAKKPAFLIVGASRSGTSSLAANLRKNARIRVAPGELHYFDLKAQNKPIAWYYAQFKRSLVNGDHSPFYQICPGVPEAVHAVLPEIKIVMMCRNPVARAYSHFRFNKVRSEERRGFLDALGMEDRRIGALLRMGRRGADVRRYSYIERGKYFKHLNRWADLFGKSQVMAIKSEDFFEHPIAIAGGICDWLGVKRHVFTPTRLQAQRYKALSEEDTGRAWRFFESTYLDRLDREWGISW